jgi:crotonobetainyl-CoA:carnitine CoA-transferase CaiB-like acyl-CoA transferase
MTEDGEKQPRGPLAGIGVVELGVVIAGPAAAAMLGDWGATVIKLEPPTAARQCRPVALPAGEPGQAQPRP